MSTPVSAPLRLGFLGAGWIAGRALAPAVHAADGAVLQAVAARDADRARALEPAGAIHTEYAALLADDQVDAVYVSLTNELHRPWVLAALAAGKHVLCEKPLGLDVEEALAMHDAASTAGLVLLEGFFYRWHPRMRRIEHLVASGALGPVRQVTSQFCFDGSTEDRMAGNYRLDPARGGGALYDVGVYPISAAHALLGPGLRVAAAGARTGPSGVDLEAEATLVGPGASAVEMRCAIDGRSGQDLLVEGEAATVATAEGEAFTSWHAPSTLTVRTPDGTVHEERFGPVDPYRLMVEAFAGHVRGGTGGTGGTGLLVGRRHSIEVATTLAAVRDLALP